MPEYVPTSATLGVPESFPVDALNEAQPGSLTIDERELVAVGVAGRRLEAIGICRVYRTGRRAGDFRRRIPGTREMMLL